MSRRSFHGTSHRCVIPVRPRTLETCTLDFCSNNQNIKCFFPRKKASMFMLGWLSWGIQYVGGIGWLDIINYQCYCCYCYNVVTSSLTKIASFLLDRCLVSEPHSWIWKPLHLGIPQNDHVTLKGHIRSHISWHSNLIFKINSPRKNPVCSGISSSHADLCPNIVCHLHLLLQYSLADSAWVTVAKKSEGECEIKHGRL